jgi:hypothetical protein
MGRRMAVGSGFTRSWWLARHAGRDELSADAFNQTPNSETTLHGRFSPAWMRASGGEHHLSPDGAVSLFFLACPNPARGRAAALPIRPKDAPSATPCRESCLALVWRFRAWIDFWLPPALGIAVSGFLLGSIV